MLTLLFVIVKSINFTNCWVLTDDFCFCLLNCYLKERGAGQTGSVLVESPLQSQEADAPSRSWVYTGGTVGLRARVGSL